MEQYICEICGYLYDEEQGVPEDGIEKGTRWDNVPEDWICPFCSASKNHFYKR